MQEENGRQTRARVSPPRHARSSERGRRDAPLVQTLGWLSLGLGLAELLAPREVSRLVGVRAHPTLVRVLGLREIVTGLGIVLQRRPAGWLWARVGGDVMDLMLLGLAVTEVPAPGGRVMATAGAGVGLMALDVISARRLSNGGGRMTSGQPVAMRKAITINRPQKEVYDFCRRFENLSRVMESLEGVHTIDEGRARWIARGPSGKRIEWETELVEDRRPSRLAWRSVPGAMIDQAGLVQFEPGHAGKGTTVRVEMEYCWPGGPAARVAALVLGQAPEQELQEGLRRMKQLLEAGEIPTTAGQPSGRARSRARAPVGLAG